MLIDFHYYVTKILCIKSGFDEDEAQTIAYASQYVDDAEKSKRFRAVGLPPIGEEILEGEILHPVATVHNDFDLISQAVGAQQKNVLIPFHFLPNQVYKKGETRNYSYLTRKNGQLANELVNEAVNEFQDDFVTRDQKLVKLGIALHSYADTWAHQNFSGRRNLKENRKKTFEVYDEKKDGWKDENVKMVFADLYPIGHGICVGRTPDYACRKLRYVMHDQQRTIGIDNVTQYMEAAKQIFAILNKIPKDEAKDWNDDLETNLKTCLEYPVDSCHEEKLDIFTEKFKGMKFNYDKFAWWKKTFRRDPRESALDRTYDVWKFKETQGFVKWIYFQQEAMKQRKFVQQRIPSKMSIYNPDVQIEDGRKFV